MIYYVGPIDYEAKGFEIDVDFDGDEQTIFDFANAGDYLAYPNEDLLVSFYDSVAEGKGSHSEGYQTKAVGDYSHTSGSNTVTTNEAEFACGKFNVSEDGTVFSVGVGEWDAYSHHEYNREDEPGFEVGLNYYTNRLNALTITDDGKVYVKGVGSYNGATVTGADSLSEVITALYNSLSDKPIV